MRWQLKVVIAALLSLGALGLASSHAQFGGFGGGLGGLMGKSQTQTDPLTLLRNASVKKELKLDDKQMTKIDAALWKALAEALTPDQVKRLREIDLQQRDYHAFGDPFVQKELKMTAAQKEDIKTILADAEKEQKDLFGGIGGILGGGGKGGGGKGGFGGLDFEKIQSLGKETKDRCTSVLTNDQKRMWIEMVGEEFKLETPGGFGGIGGIPGFDPSKFGGGGFGKGKGGKKGGGE